MKQILMFIMTWLITIATAEAQSGLNVSPLFEGKIIPTQRMVETRVKGKMLSKYQLTFFRSVRFKANNKQEINRVRNLIELDTKENPGFAYGENYSSKKSLCCNFQSKAVRTVFYAISAIKKRLRLSIWKVRSIHYLHYEN